MANEIFERIEVVDPDEPVKPSSISTADPLKGFTGCKLLFQTSPAATPVEKGLVIACPNVPNWMSGEFSNAFAEHQNGTIDITKYAPDWFEKLVYIDAADLDLAKPDMTNFTWAERMTRFGPKFDNQLSDGCGRCSPRVTVFKFKFDANGFATDLIFEDIFYAVVSGRDPNNLPRASAITIAPLDARASFVTTSVHQIALSDCDELRKLTDPFGIRRNQRMATVLAAYAYLTRPQP